MKFSHFILNGFAIFALVGCASYRPVVDDNEHYRSVGDAAAERDIDQCMADADKYLEKHKAERMKKEAGRGAVSGAIVGGVMGLLSGGNALRNTAVGAGIGAGVGAGARAAGTAAKDNLTPDEMKQGYVSRCLAKKGYDVIGWK